MKRIGIISLVLMFAATPVWAESLQDALTDAYRQNPVLLAKRAELRATDEGVAQAMSGYRPSVSVDGSIGAQNVRDRNAATDNGSLTPRGASVEVSQPVFRGFRTTAAVDRAEYEVRAGQAELLDTEQLVLLGAITSYMDVVRDQAVVELNENNVKVLERQLQATQDRFNVGELTRTDIAQSESRAERSKAGLTSAKGELASSQTRFQRIVGRGPGTLEKPQKMPSPAESRDSAISASLEGNPRITAAISREKAGRELITEVRGEELPQVSLNGVAQSGWDRAVSGDRADDYSVVARLSIPLYQAGAVAARTRAAGQTANQLLILVEQTKREVAEQAGQAWDALQTAQANIDAFQSAVKAAEVALEGVRQENEVGQRTILDILDAEQELLDARVNLVRAQRDEIVATYTLRAALGKLTARDLALDAPIYDPNVHYRNTRHKWFGYDVD